MIVRRRNWFYRLAGQMFAQSISFEQPISATSVRDVLRRSVGIPMEIWGRDKNDVMRFHN
jgi:hypothetical protein